MILALRIAVLPIMLVYSLKKCLIIASDYLNIQPLLVGKTFP